jgi:flavin-dependent dehydrogenase
MMKTMREEARSLPVAGEFDICVIGGSCTGVFAAVRAAQLGARVAIVEANGFFGGVATASLVNIWHSIYNTTGEQQIIGGLTVEVVERLLKRDAATLHMPPTAARYCSLATADLIIELDKLVTDAGVEPFLHTYFAAPLLHDGTLSAIAVEDKTGRRAIKAKYFIDATGDGDLISRMGLGCYARERVQPPTTCAIIRGLDGIKQRNPRVLIGARGLQSRLSAAP